MNTRSGRNLAGILTAVGTGVGLAIALAMVASGARAANASSMETALPASMNVAQPARMDASSGIVPITAVGSGQINAAPDSATVTLGVMVDDKTSAGASDKLNTKMDAILKAIKGLNLAGMTTQTQWINLSPQFDYNRPHRGGEAQQPEVVGYQASTTISINVTNTTHAGKVIDAAIAAGANQLQGVNFALKNDAAAKGSALALAAGDARAKAEAIASALGLKITRVLEASTGVAQRPGPIFPMAKAGMMRAAMAEAAPTQIEAGELTISAEATVIFAAEPK